MIEKLRKPKVFLSHSRKDKKFINRLAEDFRRTQIEPWLDEMEIRHGKPFLKVIFEEGIPTCDALLVYLTDASIQSKMVQKEIDAGIITQLEDNYVAFLPYLSNESLREKLRLDLKSIQCLEWNEKNYLEFLPTVVAEIWRSYTERIAHLASLEEKNKRLQAELDLQRLKSELESSAFSKAEEADFRFVFSELHRIPLFKAFFSKAGKNRRYVDTLKVPQIEILLAISREKNVFSDGAIESVIKKMAQSHPEAAEKQKSYHDVELPSEYFKDLLDRLDTFGMVKFQVGGPVYSDKFNRFRYWLMRTNIWWPVPINDPDESWVSVVSSSSVD